MTAMPDSIALALPPGWDNIPTDPVAYRQQLAQQLLQLRSNGVKRSDVRQIELLGAMVQRLVQQQQVVLSSSYLAVEGIPDTDDQDGQVSETAELTGTAADGPEGLVQQDDLAQEGDEEEVDLTVVMAGLVVSTLRRVDLDTNVPLMAEVMVKAFSEGAPADDSQAQYAEIEPPSVCKLGDVDAAKLVRLMTVTRAPGEEHKLFTQSYLVPVSAGDAVIAMQFSTINFQYARQFSELFDRIAGTLRVLYPDDPTFLDEAADVTAEAASGTTT